MCHQPENLQYPECSRMFQNVTECYRMIQNIPEYSRIFQNIPEYSRMFQNVPEFSRMFRNAFKMHSECSRMFQNACRIFQNACRKFKNVLQGRKNKRAGWFFLVLKAHRGPKNWPTDKSWVSFDKFRKFSIRWALRFLSLDQGKLRNLHLKIVTFILKSLIDDPNSPDWVSHK